MRISGIIVLISIILLGLGAAPIFVFGLSCDESNPCPTDQVCRSNICVFEKGVGVSVTIGEIAPEIIIPPLGRYIPSPTAVVFKGKTSPSAFITILKNNSVSATFSSDAKGLFFHTLNGLMSGRYTFGIWSEDTEGRKTLTLNYTVDLVEGIIFSLERILLPPTIEISSEIIEQGKELKILGQATPETQINILISSRTTKETKTDIYGKWNYFLDTAGLEPGNYLVQARALTLDGQQSPFSQALSFLVLRPPFPPPPVPPVPPVSPVPPVCKGADLNFDGKVDVFDFSILLYFWEKQNPSSRCADINSDGIVDIVDFSIMMHYWTANKIHYAK